MDYFISLGISLLGGFFAGIAAIYIWDLCSKPKLSIEIKKSSQDNEEPAIYDASSKPICENKTEGCLPDKQYAIYHLDVKNKGRTAAFDCEAEFTFFSDNKELFKPIRAKWDAKPEPLSFAKTDKGWGAVFDPSKIYYSEVVNINPGSHQSFATILKYDGESDCYPFSVWGYCCKEPWRVEDKIPKGEFTLKVKVRHSRQEPVEAKFKIENQGKDMKTVVIKKID